MSKSAVSNNLIKINFFCEKCDYTTSHKSHYDKHLQSKKHQNLCKKSAVFVKKCRSKSAAKSAVFKCPNCEKIYSTRQGLHYHKKNKKCIKKNNIIVQKEIIHVENSKPEMDDDLKTLMKGMVELCKAQQKTQEKLAENIGKMGNQYNNCNNKNLTVNVYLNEHCKNAMNLTDFVKNLTCNIEDLMYTKDNGYIKGIENIFTKQLEDLNPKERPIHCSDKKRMQFYVKEDDKWKKDEGGEKVDQVLTSVSTIQIHELGAWEKLHPNYMNDPELLKEWQSIIHAIGGNSANPKEHKKIVEKFKKTLAEKTSLKKAMKLENKED
tara:strand:- start:372 stop:1337 length:966 start_codon:yes stop_codon:yes gene_type:complete